MGSRRLVVMGVLWLSITALLMAGRASGQTRGVLPSDSLRVRLEKELAREAGAIPVIQEQLEELGVAPEEVSRLRAAEETLERARPPVAGTKEVSSFPAEQDSTKPTYFGHQLFTGAPTTFVPPTSLPVGPEYVVGPGDELDISVWGRTELSYKVAVSREGTLVLPEVGLLQVAGLTMADLEELLGGELGRVYTGIQVRISVSRLRTITVFVVGEVQRPGAYTLSSLSTVFHALYAAGGPTPTGSLRRVKLVHPGAQARIVDFYPYLLEGDNSADERLREGDTVFIPPVQALATIAGAVRRPAIYELMGETTLGDLVEMAGGKTADAYLRRISVERFWEGREKRLIDVDPISGGGGPGLATPLVDGDLVTLFAVRDERVNQVEIEGHVMRPGRYEMWDGMRAMDLVRAAEGVRGEAFLSRAEIMRTNLDRTMEVIAFDLGDALAGNPEENPLLQPLDRLRVFSLLEARPVEEVVIYGEVRSPGAYPLTPGMTLADVIFAAGGLLDRAHLGKAEIARIRPRQGAPGGGDIEVLEVSLTGYAAGSGMSALVMQQGDRVFIRRVPRWRVPETVELVGEVRFSGAYSLLREGETLWQVVARAGGITDDCYLPGVQLERRDEGRLVVDAERLLQERDMREDLALMDGDRVFFPRVPGTVRVTGEVFLPGSIKFIPGRGPGYYIDRCGGFLETADPGEVRVIRANGTVDKVRSFWFDPTVERGNIVEVPAAPLETTDWVGIFQSTAETMASIMVTIYFAKSMTD